MEDRSTLADQKLVEIVRWCLRWDAIVNTRLFNVCAFRTEHLLTRRGSRRDFFFSRSLSGRFCSRSERPHSPLTLQFRT